MIDPAQVHRGEDLTSTIVENRELIIELKDDIKYLEELCESLMKEINAINSRTV